MKKKQFNSKKKYNVVQEELSTVDKVCFSAFVATGASCIMSIPFYGFMPVVVFCASLIAVTMACKAILADIDASKRVSFVDAKPSSNGHSKQHVKRF